MPYTSSININLGSSKAGLLLSATFHDIQGNPVVDASNITSGFVEFTKGNYLWTYDNFPTNFRGCVAFYNLANDDFLAMTSINPEDAELVADIDNAVTNINNSVTNISNKVDNIEAVIDELTNPPKEITIEVPQISTKCKNIEITTNIANTPSIEIVTGVG